MRVGDLVKHSSTGREGWIHVIRDSSQEADDSWDCIIVWSDTTQERLLEQDFEIITPLVYVNVYLRDRAYGGPEEGGWWYGVQSIEFTFRCKDEKHAKQVYDMMFIKYEDENRNRNSDISSVTSEGRYDVELEAWPGEHSPLNRPYYS